MVRQLDERRPATEVVEWVERCADWLLDRPPRDVFAGTFTYLNIRNLICNALGGPHIDPGQVRYAVGRSPRFRRWPHRRVAGMTLYTPVSASVARRKAA